jgi:peptidoglycan-associated lipoprotein
MKTLAVALTHVLLALAIANTTACSTTQAVKQKVTDEAAERAALVRELNALVAQGPLYFETDTDVLTEDSQVLLQRIAAQMHRVPRVRVIIGGHADERGDTSYNLALGERRAETAKDYLKHLGIPKERVQIVSLGEEQPIAVGHNEDAWSQNRRDEFTFLLPGESRSVLNIGVVDESSSLVATTTYTNE